MLHLGGLNADLLLLLIIQLERGYRLTASPFGHAGGRSRLTTLCLSTDD